MYEPESEKDVTDKLPVEEQNDEEIYFPEINLTVAEQREEKKTYHLELRMGKKLTFQFKRAR